MSIKEEVKASSRKRKAKQREHPITKRLSMAVGEKEVSQADWSTCSGDLMKSLVVSIGDLGGAVIFGYSRDKSSHALTLLLDGEKEALYLGSEADLDDKMQRIIVGLEDLE